MLHQSYKVLAPPPHIDQLSRTGPTYCNTPFPIQLPQMVTNSRSVGLPHIAATNPSFGTGHHHPLSFCSVSLRNLSIPSRQGTSKMALIVHNRDMKRFSRGAWRKEKQRKTSRVSNGNSIIHFVPLMKHITRKLGSPPLAPLRHGQSSLRRRHLLSYSAPINFLQHHHAPLWV